MVLTVTAENDKNIYRNTLTGKIPMGKWSKPSNGLECRIGVSKKLFSLGSNPIVVLQVRNVSSKPIAINDLFFSEMMINIKPNKGIYYNHDFQWIYNEKLLKNSLESGKYIEAICRIQKRLLPLAISYTLSMKISRGLYPKNSKGILMRGNWWSGILDTPVVKISIK